MSQIKVGDMVQLVFSCCSAGRSYIGWTGIVKDARDGGQECTNCGYVTHGYHARLGISDNNPAHDAGVPFSWLIKVEPPSKEETETTEEELAA